MDLTSLFLWAIITAIIDIVAKALIGFNLKEFLAEVTVIPFAGPVVLFLITSPHDVAVTTSFLGCENKFKSKRFQGKPCKNSFF